MILKYFMVFTFVAIMAATVALTGKTGKRFYGILIRRKRK